MRTVYTNAEALPAGIDLGKPNRDVVLSCVAGDWDHVAVMDVDWHSEPQACGTCGVVGTPAVNALFMGGAHAFYCAEHAADVEAHRGVDGTFSIGRGGPGWWVAVEGGGVRLIVTNKATGARHPELDDARYADASEAYAAAYAAGLLNVIVFDR